MKFVFTSRHFKAHTSLKDFAQIEIEKISKYYDGIIKSEVILSFEKATNSVKIAEVIITTNTHSVITAKDRSDDFKISIEGAVDKAASQIKKLKEKIKSNHTAKLTMPFDYH
jgi:ribosomal subunit interface protein